ncbi:hypothetical protein R3P38DRAFT_2880678 [Favolaschia claudopus]|uniref:Tim44-like domain-containing protein n=1 Tax=Favolaschia claudopus TaxID=2862362 RepID=A0AAW0CXD4_9AGAR
MFRSCRRAPASIRHYASAASKKKPPPLKKPAPPPTPTPRGNLKGRILASQQRTWEKREATAQQQQQNVADSKSIALDESLSEEERQIKLVEQVELQRELMRREGRTPPVITLPLLDHMIPYSAGLKAWREYSSIPDMWRQFRKNRINSGKNAFSMRHIAVADSFPGVEIDANMGWLRSLYLFSLRVFQAQSLKSDAWVATMRQEVLEQYLHLNEAIMKGNTKRIQDLTMPPYADEVLALAEKKPRGTLYRWTFHREVTPTRILSLRAGDGEFSKHMPETGSRVAIQALVRFDTEQSVEMYDKAGRALHTPAPLAAPQPAKRGDTIVPVPAVPKRVTEYLVVDKACYDPNGRWKFRARYVPEAGRTQAI